MSKGINWSLKPKVTEWDVSVHYLGSFTLATILFYRIIGLPPLASALIALGLGFLWELKDILAGVGLDVRDLIADFLGVATFYLAFSPIFGG